MAMDNVKKFFSVEMSPYVKITGVELRENNQPTEEELPKIKKHYKKANTENVAVFELSFCNTIHLNNFYILIFSYFLSPSLRYFLSYIHIIMDFFMKVNSFK